MCVARQAALTAQHHFSWLGCRGDRLGRRPEDERPAGHEIEDLPPPPAVQHRGRPGPARRRFERSDDHSGMQWGKPGQGAVSAEGRCSVQKPQSSAGLCRHAHLSNTSPVSVMLAAAGWGQLAVNRAQAAGVVHTEALLVMSAKKPPQRAKRPALPPGLFLTVLLHSRGDCLCGPACRGGGAWWQAQGGAARARSQLRVVREAGCREQQGERCRAAAPGAS